MILSTMRASSWVVESDVPGAVVMATMRVSSLKLGRNSFGISLNLMMQKVRRMRPSAMVRVGKRRAAFMKVSSNTFLSDAMMMPSLCSMFSRGLRNMEQRTGMTVRDTTKEAIMLVMVAMAMGVKSLPATPESARSGTKTRMMKMVA